MTTDVFFKAERTDHENSPIIFVVYIYHDTVLDNCHWICSSAGARVMYIGMGVGCRLADLAHFWKFHSVIWELLLSLISSNSVTMSAAVGLCSGSKHVHASWPRYKCRHSPVFTQVACTFRQRLVSCHLWASFQCQLSCFDICSRLPDNEILIGDYRREKEPFHMPKCQFF